VTLDDMVADTLAVMDAAGVGDAHILGVSMGGMVAQRLALEHRDRVRSLILGCTTARARAGLPPWRLIAAASIRQLAPRQATELVVPLLYAERTRREAPERILEDLRMRNRDSTSPATIFAQMAAVGSHDVRSRLAELEGLQVTVIHGSEDALIGADRGRELAARIPGARLREIDDCGHLLLTDAQDAVMAAIDEHLRRAGALAEPADAPAGGVLRPVAPKP
jgi:pimeloyl-ACP methyl ester carboxylesterase